MQNDQEFSDTPTGDAAEEFLNTPNGQESKPSLLQKEVLRLYAQADSIKELLQRAAIEGNSVLLDPDSLSERWGLKLSSDVGLSHEEALADIKDGKIDLICDVSENFLDSTKPRLVLDGKAMTKVALRNWIHKPWLLDERFRNSQIYLLHVRTEGSGSDNPVNYKLVVSDKGGWIKHKFGYMDYLGDDDFQESFEMMPHDSELADTAIGILKSHLTRALASPNQDQ